MTETIVHRGTSYRWVVLVLGTGAQAIFGAYVQGLAAITPTLRDEMGLSLTGIGFILACPTLGVVLTLVLWGRACDRYGEESVMGFGLAGAAVLLALAATAAPSAPIVGALLVAAGAAAAGVSVASGSALLGWFPPHQRGFAMGLRASSLPVGAALAAIVLPPMASWGGLPGVFGLLSVSCLLGGLVMAFGVRSPMPVPTAADQRRSPHIDREQFRQLLRLSSASVLLMLPQIGIMALMMAFLTDYRGLAVTTGAAILTSAHLVGAVSRLGAGMWSDLVRSRLRPLWLVAAGAGPLSLLVAGLTDAPTPVLVGTLLACGAVVVCWNPLAVSAASEMVGPGRSGTAIGIQNTAIFGGATIAPPLVGILADGLSWQVAFGALALPAVIATVLLAPLARPARLLAAPAIP